MMPLWLFVPLAVAVLFLDLLVLDSPDGWLPAIPITGGLVILCLVEAGVLS